MITHRLTHTVNIHKATHTLAGAKKSTGWTPNATVVPARLESLTDAPTATLLGKAVTETFRVFFGAGTDVEEGDKIIFLDRTPNWTLLVRTVQAFSGLRPGREDHIEVTAIRQRVAN